MHPILFHHKSFTIYSYGFFVALAVLAAFFISGRLARQKGLPREVITDLIFLLFVSGVVGARVFYILQNFHYYKDDPLGMISISEGGLVWYGGFILAALSGLLYAWLKKLPLLRLCDFFSPVLAFSHGIGRLGCFFNGCCYGKPWKGPFAVLFPGDSSLRHAVQVYESLALFGLACLLLLFYSGKRSEGEVFAGYLLGYGAIRFLTEHLRGDQVVMTGFTIPQWISVCLVVSGAVLFAVVRRKRREL